MIAFVGKLDNRFKARFTARFEQYEFQAGVMPSDGEKKHYEAKSITLKSGKRKKRKSAFTTVDGMTARKRRGYLFGNEPTIKQIYQFACRYVRSDIVKDPFLSPNSGPMRKLSKALSKFFQADRPMAQRRKVEDAMLNVIRDPIKKKNYRPNSRAWAKVKGFNRALFDTGQLYRSFKAKVSRIPKPKAGPSV